MRCVTATGDALAAAAAEGTRELPHAPTDPLVDPVEHLLVLIDGIADRSRLTQSWVYVPEDYHVAWPAPKALTHKSPLGRVHYHDEVGSTCQIGGHQARLMAGEIHAMPLRRNPCLDGRRPLE